MLEDDFEDVLGKAMRGLGKSLAALAAETSLPQDAISSLLKGNMDQAHARACATALQLSGDALISLPSYKPDTPLPAGIQVCVTPFGHIGVNSWIIQHRGSQILFDCGTKGSTIAKALSPAKLDALLITHNHPDHVVGYPELAPLSAQHYGPCDLNLAGITSLKHGDQLALGSLNFRCIDVTGHSTYTSGSPLALAYYSEDLDTPICIVGDALFAGSMGGCTTLNRYKMSLDSLQKRLGSLPKDTIFLPGHGPPTTLASELQHNPFFGS